MTRIDLNRSEMTRNDLISRDLNLAGFTWDKVKMSLIDLDLPDLILITLEFFFRNLNFEANLFHLRVARPIRKKYFEKFWSFKVTLDHEKNLFKIIQVHFKDAQPISW